MKSVEYPSLIELLSCFSECEVPIINIKYDCMLNRFLVSSTFYVLGKQKKIGTCLPVTEIELGIRAMYYKYLQIRELK